MLRAGGGAVTDRIFNLRERDVPPAEDSPAGHEFGWEMAGRSLGATLTGMGLYELPPGQRLWPYHYELSREEWLIVVEGEVTLRTPSGESVLRSGDVVCFPVGEKGAHSVRNDSSAPARFVMPSSRSEDGFVAIRPDSKTAFVVGAGFHAVLSLDGERGFWDGEA